MTTTEYAGGRMIAETRDGIGWMIFNQPQKRNAMTYAMWEAIPPIIAGFQADPDVRVVVMKGAGDKAFVSGADISEFETMRSSPEQTREYDLSGDRAHAAMAALEKPLIAQIRGWCMGGGAAISLDADIRICSDDSHFGVPAAKLGVGYGYDGIRTLVDLVGPTFAKEIFFLGKPFTAEDARIMGLVNRVVPAEKLEETVLEYCTIIKHNAPMTIRAAKAAINAAVKDESGRNLAAVAEMVEACFASRDYTEGYTAFMEKRRPAFQGR
ncbi:MAG: enoyl-CoA hydratase/isomerase family protein [Alphaproteobacteria bacterium]|nr:enoyl-CoA hydratase/isomerase family protein [Alphaproteobacteria bacterium]MCB9931476.1 enoyl-CoA hydratase/isomerase family protein [Alphaproteobacteria bacterium]